MLRPTKFISKYAKQNLFLNKFVMERLFFKYHQRIGYSSRNRIEIFF